MRIPCATYRLQMFKDFRFADARAAVPYLDALGVTDLYASPILKARPGSGHGYDVTDPTALNPEIGTEDELRALSEDLRARGMGIVLDVVPNHMCIADAGNRWWQDVLENGPGSPFASHFDIDWNPPKAELRNKVLLPFLGDQYGRVLEDGHIKVVRDDDLLLLQFYEGRLPLAPRTWRAVLEPALDALVAAAKAPAGELDELRSIITALNYLPARNELDPARVAERRREKEVVRRRVGALVRASAAVAQAVDASITAINGAKGDPRSFDRLEALLADQPYRLSFWRVAADEINYRRFFDVNELAAICVERPQVFASVHELVFRLVREGIVTGLRIDHVDGLHDPRRYLEELQQGCRAALEAGGGKPGERATYVVVEKILEHGERLPSSWPCEGTTGYDFLAELNGLFVDRTARRAVRAAYDRFAGKAREFADVANTAKKLIMLVSQSSEVHVLAVKLDHISEQHRFSRDFTRESLRFALREVIASFPVYRTYIRSGDSSVEPGDRACIVAAIEDAKRRNPATSRSLFDFVGALLLLDDPAGTSDAAREERRAFVMRFQQLTGPVTAKGVEDTTFYRWFPLASLNEVGSDPRVFGVRKSEWHRANQERLRDRPHSLLATSTHDTKRSEDVRARINVLSEMVDRWRDALERFRERNRSKKARAGAGDAPDRNDEYLLYQTLVGAWPLEEKERGAPFVKRIQDYMLKAMREAKVRTSWIQPDQEYEAGVSRFIEAILEESPGNAFLADLRELAGAVAPLGAASSLSQALLKVCAPGIPDFYQGTELWTLTLVDPDNRRVVDLARRAGMLAELDRRAETEGRAALARDLCARWEDGRVKLWLTACALRFRRAHRAIFERGAYAPAHATDGMARHIVSFMRSEGGAHALAVAPRLLARFAQGRELPSGERVYGGSQLLLPAGAPSRWRDAITGESVEAVNGGLPLAKVLVGFPVALLESVG